MKNIALFIFFAFMMFACTDNKQESTKVKIIRINEFEVNIDSKFIVPLNVRMTDNNSNSSYQVFFQRIKTKEIVTFNLTKSYLKLITNTKYDINNFYCNLFFYSSDSIFSFNNGGNQVVLQNPFGNILKTYQINNEYLPLTTPKIRLNGCIGRLLLGNSSRDINFGKMDERKLFYHSIKPLLILDYTDSIPVCMAIADFPEKYLVSGDNYFDPNPSACFGNDGLICVSFGADDYLYLYNDSTLILKKKVNSKFIDKFNPYPDSKIFDMLYLKNYEIEEPKYITIIFDPWENLYYRVVKHRIEKGKKMKNTWSVIVMDKKLDVLYEMLFDYQYDPKIFVPTPFGILMLDKRRSSYNNSIFEIFKFKRDE